MNNKKELNAIFNKELSLLKEHAKNLETELKAIKEQIGNLELLKEASIKFDDDRIRPIAPLSITEAIKTE